MFSRNIKYLFLVSLFVAVIYPTANIFFVFPSFSKLSIINAERNSLQIGRFLSDSVIDRNNNLKNIDELERAVGTFNLYKIKFYANSGITLYSTDPADISKKNTKPYFQEIVAAGQAYSKFVVKDGITAEGEKTKYDVVETYVPIMKNGLFLGAFEIYQNITDRHAALKNTASKFAIFSIIIMAFFLLIVIVMLLRIDKDFFDPDRQLSIPRQQSPLAILFFMILALFVAESMVMALLSFWDIPSLTMEILVDSTLLVILAAPMIYFFVNRPLLAHIAQNKRDQEEISHHYQAEQIMRKILNLTTKDLSLQEVLEEFIRLITSLPWLEVQAKGAVFLVGDKPNTLVLKAHHNLHEALLDKCSLVPFGTCLCGKAALTGETIFTNCINEDHHISYEGITPHGHYCVPFYSPTKQLLGVFTLYTKAGTIRNKEVEETLKAASYLLAGVINRKRIEEILQQSSVTDELTGLLNRRGFMRMAERHLRISERRKNTVLLLFADMDNLKEINDELGHQAGDDAIVKIGEILKSTFRETDIIGRMGGDEFAVLFTTNVETYHYPTVVNRIEENITEWNDRSDRVFELSLSTGVADYSPDTPQTLEKLLANADAAMYEIKQRKRAK